MMKQITLTEKRFFEWHEDDVSVTLRNKSGSYGGVVRFLSLNVLGMIAGHPTPKICEVGVAYTINQRDYKGVMIIVVSEDNGIVDGEQPSRELLRTGRLQQYVGHGEK